MSLIYTVMVCLVSLIFVQFLLLTVALEGYLGGRIEVALPTALVSGLCCAAAYWLLRYILCRSALTTATLTLPIEGDGMR